MAKARRAGRARRVLLGMFHQAGPVLLRNLDDLYKFGGLFERPRRDLRELDGGKVGVLQQLHYRWHLRRRGGQNRFDDLLEVLWGGGGKRGCGGGRREVFTPDSHLVEHQPKEKGGHLFGGLTLAKLEELKVVEGGQAQDGVFKVSQLAHLLIHKDVTRMQVGHREAHSQEELDSLENLPPVKADCRLLEGVAMFFGQVLGPIVSPWLLVVDVVLQTALGKVRAHHQSGALLLDKLGFLHWQQVGVLDGFEGRSKEMFCQVIRQRALLSP